VTTTARGLSRLGQAALEYSQEYGLAVFPLWGKHPLKDSGGYLDGTTAAEQIGRWWDATPSANIGAAPGSASLVVVDVDGPDGEDLARSLGVLTVATAEVVTARGAHRWFRLPKGIEVGNIPRTELDIRAHKGYVILPPSVHPSGHVYYWRGSLDRVADAPDALLTWLRQQVAKPAPAPPAKPIAPRPWPDQFSEKRVLKYVDRIGFGLSDGRKQAAYRFAAFLAHDVALDVTAVTAYVRTWNRHNAPPLDSDLLDTIIANGRKYGQHRS
jgi:hypothetical protein